MHFKKQICDKPVYSTVLHVFAMEGHIQEQLVILVEVTKCINSCSPMLVDLVHTVLKTC